MANDDSIKRTYGEWLALSKPDRVRLGLPTSQAKWAEAYGVTQKTATRWKQDDPVVLATLNRARARENPPEEAGVDSDAEGLDRLEENLMVKALKGDEKAIEQYLRWFGKDELEARRRAEHDRITTMTEDELKAEILEMVGREEVEKWLSASAS